ncbi:MAG TPA: hypothetical protein DEV93_01305 [Chloroflexi bacterium]|nr:hypothetical protein [Chloroflexota bacterium]
MRKIERRLDSQLLSLPVPDLYTWGCTEDGRSFSDQALSTAGSLDQRVLRMARARTVDHFLKGSNSRNQPPDCIQGFEDEDP